MGLPVVKLFIGEESRMAWLSHSGYGSFSPVPLDIRLEYKSKSIKRIFFLLAITIVTISCVLLQSNSIYLLGRTTITVSNSPTVPSSLPLGWEVRYTTRGVPFYYDAINDVTSFTPPQPVPYPAVLNYPIFTQPYPSLFPQSALVTNSPLHKWGQFGMGTVPYTPYAPSPQVIYSSC